MDMTSTNCVLIAFLAGMQALTAYSLHKTIVATAQLHEIVITKRLKVVTTKREDK